MKTLLSQVSFRDMLMQTGKRNQISQLSLGPGDFKASHNSSGQQSSKRRLDFKPKVCSYILFCILQQIKIYYKRHMSCYKTLFLPAKSISRIVANVNDIQFLESPIPATTPASQKASSGDILGTKRGIIDPLVSKRLEKILEKKP